MSGWFSASFKPRLWMRMSSIWNSMLKYRFKTLILPLGRYTNWEESEGNLETMWKLCHIRAQVLVFSEWGRGGFEDQAWLWILNFQAEYSDMASVFHVLKISPTLAKLLHVVLWIYRQKYLILTLKFEAHWLHKNYLSPWLSMWIL